MADLTRPDFGEAWASEGEKLSPDSVKIKLGWVQEMMPYQFENFLQSRQDEAILYLLQKGVPEYSPTQEYTANKSVVMYQGSLYMATATVTGVLPTVTASWKRISPTVGTNGAVVISSGGTGATSVTEARTNLGLGSASTANLPSTNGVVVRSADNTLISRLLTGTSGNISITNPDGVAGNININVGTNVAQLDKDSSWTSKGGITLPKGSSSERGVEVPGKIRYNTELQKFEGYNGTSWNALGATSEVEITTLSGDGITTSFTLNTPAFSESSTDVYIGGVYQNKGTYSVSGTTLTFSEAPTLGTDNIQVVSRRVVDLGIARASQVSIEDAANKYTATTVEGALMEITEYEGEIEAEASWDDVPKHKTTAFNTQAQALANRVELVKDSLIINKGAAPAFLKTVSDIVNREPVSIFQFIPNEEVANIVAGVSDYDCTSSMSDFFNSVSVGYLNDGVFNVPDTVVISREKPIVVYGSGEFTRIIGNHNGVAGGKILQFNSGGVKLSNLLIESTSSAKRAIAIAVEAQPGNISDFVFDSILSKNNFYAIRATSLDGGVSRVNNLSIRNSFSVAPSGSTNSGHFMVQYTSGVEIHNCHTRGGFNTSAFGFTKDTRGILVSGCTERGVIHSANYVEGSLQIEECPNAGATIVSNSFGTDIWISDSSGVLVSGNTCGRLRVTVGNAADDYGAKNLKFIGNSATGIRCTSYGVSPISERIDAVFESNTLDPIKNAAGVLNTTAIQLDGRYIGKVKLKRNELISDATTNSITIIRGEGSEIHLERNDFGSKPSLLSGSGGVILDLTNKNPISKNVNGGVTAKLAADETGLVSDSWTTLALDFKSDLNSEYNTSDGYYTAKVDGWYAASGVVTFGSLISSAKCGARLVVIKGGAVTELQRGGLSGVYVAGAESRVIGQTQVYLSAGDSVALQYFVSGSSAATIVSSEVTKLVVNFAH